MAARAFSILIAAKTSVIARNASAAFPFAIEMSALTPESVAKRIKASTTKRQRVMRRGRVSKKLKDFHYAPDSGGKADVAEGPNRVNPEVATTRLSGSN